MNTVNFHDWNIKSNLKQRRRLKDFCKQIFKKEGKPLQDLNIIFCRDSSLLELNLKFLQHNYFTDTISFTLSKPKNPITGEVYISIDRVRDNASALHHPYQIELITVIIHGCLHLCGYKDKTVINKNSMTSRQDLYVKKWMFHVKHG